MSKVKDYTICLSDEELKTCKVCNASFNTPTEMAYHLKKLHGMTKESYIVQYYFDTYPICNCGCGTKLTFKPSKNGPFFKNYTKNHAPRQSHTSDTKKKIRDSVKSIIRKKFGVDNVMELDEFKSKIKNTKLLRYGDSHYNNVKQTELTKEERYGDKNYNNSDKIIETNLKKYGAHSYTATTDGISQIKKTKELRYGDASYNNQAKIRETSNALYGVDYYQQTDDYKKRIGLNTLTKFENYNITPMVDIDTYNGVSGLKYDFKCDICTFEFKASIDNGRIPSCPICTKKYGSSYNKELYEFISEHYDGKIELNTYDVIPPKEIDIYLPELRLAIEFNGLYYHSEVGGGKNKTYHVSKTTECNSRNIKLIHIFENEWVYKKDVVKSIILANISNPISVYGRQTTISMVDVGIARSFLDTNHIQGKDTASLYYGLFNGGELTSVMSFVKSRYNKNYQWEISRYCNKLQHRIVGGASKLYKKFVDEHNPTSIITYSDARYFDGSVYSSIGFNFVEKTKPSYFYFKGGLTLFNRMQFQKHKLKNKLLKFDESLTEWENMQLNGYDRIWDCGNYKYEYIL